MGLCKVVFKMVYCTLTLRIIRSVYINHFETTTNPDYMREHNQKKDTHTLDFDVTLQLKHLVCKSPRLLTEYHPTYCANIGLPPSCPWGEDSWGEGRW